MPLQNYKTNKLPIIIAVIVLFFFYSGIIYAVTFAGSPKSITIGEAPTSLVMHHINLAGVDDALEVTNQHDDEDVLSDVTEPEEVVKEEEKVEDTPKEEIVEKPLEKAPEETVEVAKVEEKEIIATKERTVDAPKIQAQKKVVKKAEPPKKVVANKPAAKRQSKRVQQNVVLNSNQVRVLSQPKPNYPRPVIMRNLKGMTTVLIKIDKNGRAVSVTVTKSSGNQQMDDAAKKAAMQTRIQPYLVDGQPIELTVRTIYERS